MKGLPQRRGLLCYRDKNTRRTVIEKKELYIKWTKSGTNLGGIFYVKLENEFFNYKHVRGSAIPANQLAGFLWCWPGLQESREQAAKLDRKYQWSIGHRKGMSGAENWWIRSMDQYGMIRSGNTTFHSSMYGSANETLLCWIKDLYDTLWCLEKTGVEEFKKSFDENDTEYSFIDISERILSEKEEFLKDCFEPEQGFGTDNKVELEPKFGDPDFDYSSYEPTSSEEKSDEEEDEFV
jgi:hypothetical protein